MDEDILGKLFKVEEKVRDIEASLAEQLRKITDMFTHITQTTKGKKVLKREPKKG